MKTKAIIIDDHAASIEVLAQKLAHYDDIELVGTATNAQVGINLLREAQPRLLFLDVELPDMSGVEFLEMVHSVASGQCLVVMYTAHPQYMLSAFRGRAFDYLLKPIDNAELDGIIERVRARHTEPGEAATPAARTKDDQLAKEANKMLLYTNSVDFRLVHKQDIGLFQYNHEMRVWEVVVAGRKPPIRLKRNVNNETLVDIDERFIQVSQRYVININYLLEVNDNICRFYPPFDHIDYVKVGRFFRKRLIDRFCAL